MISQTAVGTGISREEIVYRIVLGIILSGITIVLPFVVSWAVGQLVSICLKNCKKASKRLFSK